jgi:hypothetical protein
MIPDRGGGLRGMSTPIVTETPLRSEPVARDTFIDDVKDAAGTPANPSNDGLRRRRMPWDGI